MFRQGITLRNGSKNYDIHGDQDLFDTEVIGNAILNLMQNKALLRDKQIISLYGPRGWGKTTLVHYIKDHIDKSTADVIIFDAWQYSFSENLAIALLNCVTDHHERTTPISEEFSTAVSEITKIIQYIDEGNASSKTIKLIKTAFSRIAAALTGDQGSLYIIIDDLDSCFPQDAVNFLSLIKNFFASHVNLKFICTIDKEIFVRAQELIPKTINQPNAYLDKLFDFSYELPSKINVTNYIKSIIKDDGADPINANEFVRLVNALELNNPRRLIKSIDSAHLLIEHMFASSWHKRIFRNLGPTKEVLLSKSYVDYKFFYELLLYFIVMKADFREDFDMMIDFSSKEQKIQQNSPLLEYANIGYGAVTFYVQPPKVHSVTFSALQTAGGSPASVTKLIFMLLSPQIHVVRDGNLYAANGNHTKIKATLLSASINDSIRISSSIIDHLFITDESSDRYALRDEYLIAVNHIEYDLDVHELYLFVKEH